MAAGRAAIRRQLRRPEPALPVVPADRHHAGASTWRADLADRHRPFAPPGGTLTMRRICRGSAGFTLMEAMLATLLMVIVMGALATVTAQWLPNWDRGANRLQRVELLAAGLDRLVSDVAAAQYVSTGDVFAAPYFDGGELSVTFVRTTLGPNTLTGLEIVQIAETSDRLGIALVRRTAPFIPVGGQAAALNFANPVVMVRAPYRVTFSYAGPDRVWRDTWRGATQLPRAIRIRV